MRPHVYLLCALLSWSATATAQEPPQAAPQDAPPAGEPATPPQPAAEPTPEPAQQAAKAVEVAVTIGSARQPLVSAPLLLRAARPKGPFEPTDPTPVQEWSAMTDAAGVARFEGVPDTLATQGLRLHAVAIYQGQPFKSAAIVPSSNAKLAISAFEKGAGVDAVRVASLRMVVEPWEGYLVFTQIIGLTAAGDRALDTQLIADPAWAKGLPIELPLKAQGINISGPGEHEAINSTVRWRGVLKPGEVTTLQLRYSMPAHEPTFTYSQPTAYEVGEVDILIPLQTPHKKLPRLNGLEMAAPGFALEAGAGLAGLRPDMEFLRGAKAGLKAGEPLRFQLRGLPFKKPVGPWVALGAGLLMALAALGYGLRLRSDEDAAPKTEALVAELNAQHAALFEELVSLEQAYKAGRVDVRDYEVESLSLRGRLALIKRKVEELSPA
jgi:hypothetical protein